MRRRRLAALGALLRCVAAACGCPAPAAARGARDRAGHAAAVPRARLRRQLPDGAALDAPQRRRARERRPRHATCASTPLAAQRTPLRRRPRARREREHDRTRPSPRRSSAARTFVTRTRKRDRGHRHRRLQRRRLGAAGDLTSDAEALTQALAQPARRSPTARASTTRSTRSLALLRDAQALGRIDRPALGRRRRRQQLERSTRVVAAANEQRVRIFTVGLRSGAYDASRAPEIADRTGGTYAEASSAAELAAIYDELGQRARGRVPRPLPLRRPARCRRSTSTITLAGAGNARADYVAPTPAALAPYHRSLVSRFVLRTGVARWWSGSPSGCSLGWALLLLTRGPEAQRSSTGRPASPPRFRRNLVEHQRAVVAQGDDREPLHAQAGGRSSSATSSSRGSTGPRGRSWSRRSEPPSCSRSCSRRSRRRSWRSSGSWRLR